VTRSRLVLAVIAGVLVLSGCSASQGHPPKAATGPWSLTYEGAKPVRLAVAVGAVEIRGNTAVFGFSDVEDRPEGQLGSLDLATGRRTVLARSEFRGGSIAAAVRVGDQEVYLDTSDPGDLTPGASKWRVIVLSTHRVLATSGAERVTMVPDLTSIDGAAVWTVYPDRGGSDVRAYGWEPGGKVERRDALPGDELECTPPASSPERVGDCDQDGGWIAWSEKARPHDAAGRDNPVEIFAARDGAGGKVELAKTFADNAGHLVVFGDYVAWTTDDGGVRVASLLHPSASTEVLAASPAALTYLAASDGGRLALVSEGEHGTDLRVIGADRFDLSRSQRPGP
jgi:hypothetical protein